MWRFIFFVAIFISAFFPFIGDAQYGQYNELGFTCAPGFLQFGRVCRKIIYSYVDCPRGHAGIMPCAEDKRICLSEDERGRVKESPASRGCRENFEHSIRNREDICIGLIKNVFGPAEVKCEEGCHLVNGECKRPTSIRQGCTMIDGVCYDNSCAPKRLYCPQGQLNHSRCEETILRQREYLCPAGSHLGFACVRQKKGTTGCRDTVEVNSIGICPSGYDYHLYGRCISRTEVAAIPV